MCNTHFVKIFFMNYGIFFKEARKQCNMTQREVAAKLGIHQSNISDWENDVSRPEYERLIELAELYDVSIYELLGIKEDF